MGNFARKVDDVTICVVGLGYVGLPLAIQFAKRNFSVIGFDQNVARIEELKNGFDTTMEILETSVLKSTTIKFTTDKNDLKPANFYIVTVPTPVDEVKKPDLSALIKASKSIGKNLDFGDFVVYESTVYPGATEEICIPVLEDFSNLQVNKDFLVGYSPERINPGDKTRSISDIIKVTSGSNEFAANFIDELYSRIIDVGTHKAPSIKVAEAAKVIENTQRDLNIALMNELSMIFNKMSIDTIEVLKAAETKWNFFPFRPGLVGGHCIGVDPYYLTYKAIEIGFDPKVILAGRKTNDFMPTYVSGKVVEKLLSKERELKTARILILGVTFKENCPDMRNSKVVELAHRIIDYEIEVDIFDPLIEQNMAKNALGLNIISIPQKFEYDAIIVAVAHEEFRSWGLAKIKKYLKPGGQIFDLKGIFDQNDGYFRL